MLAAEDHAMVVTDGTIPAMSARPAETDWGVTAGVMRTFPPNTAMGWAGWLSWQMRWAQ